MQLRIDTTRWPWHEDHYWLRFTICFFCQAIDLQIKRLITENKWPFSNYNSLQMNSYGLYDFPCDTGSRQPLGHWPLSSYLPPSCGTKLRLGGRHVTGLLGLLGFGLLQKDKFQSFKFPSWKDNVCEKLRKQKLYLKKIFPNFEFENCKIVSNNHN